MNFDVIKTILPNSSQDLDNLRRKYGDKLAERRLFGSFTKLIKILSYNDEGAIIAERKKKEKRVAGLNHIINKCKKVKNKQVRKIEKLESKILEINREPDYVEELEPVIKESNMVIAGVDRILYDSVVKELTETKQQLERVSLKLMVKDHLVAEAKMADLNTSGNILCGKQGEDVVSSVDKSTIMQLVGAHISPEIITSVSTQTDPTYHQHSGDCPECVGYSNDVRRERFGDEKVALHIMSILNKHNFMQPNKHETILLVKKAMLDIQKSIKHKFSLFLSSKMVSLCDLLLFSFNQMERLRQEEIEIVRQKLNELK